jgi:hypothetical protein
VKTSLLFNKLLIAASPQVLVYNFVSFHSSLLKNFILKMLGNFILKVISNFFILNIIVNFTKNFLNLLFFLKNSSFFQLKSIVDIIVVDYPFNLQKRFKLIYCFLSYIFSNRINLFFFLKE